MDVAVGGDRPPGEQADEPAVGDGGALCPKEKPWYVRCKGPLIIFAIVIAAIVIWWLYLRQTWGDDGVADHDAMNVKVIDVPYLENCCSWWPISHFILFFILGYFFPECWWELIIFGVLWELFEVVMWLFMKRGRQSVRNTQSGTIEYSADWWAGSFKDVLMNSIGVLTGVLLRRAVDGAAGETRDACGNIVFAEK